jgi:NAD(P)-dependent dehydrogenase (short-subunit alcohol dehydrogenase family)
MPYSLKGRNVVTGGSRHAHLLSTPSWVKTLMLGNGIGATICERLVSEGCNIAVNYLLSEDIAKEVATKVEKHSVKALVIQGVFPTANRN